MRSSPALSADGKTVYVGGYDGLLHAVDTTSGELVWTAGLDDVMASAPAVGADGTIYCGTFASTVRAIKPNGEIKWTAAMNGKITTDIAISEEAEMLFITQKAGFVNGITTVPVPALEAPAGTTVWTFDVGAFVGVPLNAPPLHTEGDGKVFVVAGDGNVYSLGTQGEPLWETPLYLNTDVASTLAVGPDGTLYFGAKNGKLYAVGP